jgi:hypothetical protein
LRVSSAAIGRFASSSLGNPELANYIGKNLVHLIDRDEDDAYCFRLHKDRLAASQHFSPDCY